MICMKKTLNIDAKLLKDAKNACGAKTDTETVQLGLQALIRRAAYKRLATYGGTEPETQDVPRRREEPISEESNEHRRIA